MNSRKANNFLYSAGKNERNLTLVSLLALTTTFIASNLDVSFTAKLIVFIVTILLYGIFGLIVYLPEKNENSKTLDDSLSGNLFNDEVEAKLFALEEANEFFGASLKYADMFRLVTNRLNEIVPFATCVLFTTNGEKSVLNFQFAAGKNSSEFSNLKIKSGNGLAGAVLESGEPWLEENLSEDRKIISAKALSNLQSGVAVPLFRDTEIFSVLVLYGDEKNQLTLKSLKLLEVAAARIAPLFISSQAFENNLTNALTDNLTSLPNERAFYIVLENQIAEAQRFRGDRPLTIFAADIKNFDEINRKFGHITGDRLLAFAADKIKTELRQMDLLARINGDEFFAILPTASDSIAGEIIERVRKVFVLNAFQINETENVYLQINFGLASFGQDGETTESLMNRARTKKQQSKTAVGENKILFFPKEFVN